MDIKPYTVDYDENSIPTGITYYFIGQPKTGKSTQAAQWSSEGKKGVLVLDTDLGCDFINNANVLPIVSFNQPVKEVKEKDDIVYEVIPPEKRGYVYRTGKHQGKTMPVYSMTEAWKWIKENWAEQPYDTLVIDTIDQVNAWIEKIVVEELQINEMGSGGYGTDWAKARKKNTNLVLKMQRLMKKMGSTLILTSHSKKTNIKDDKVQLGPNLPAGLGNRLTSKADIVGITNISSKTGEYQISFKGYDERACGSRFKALAQKVLPFDYQAIVKEIKEFEGGK